MKQSIRRAAVAIGLIDDHAAHFTTAQERLTTAQSAHREVVGRADELRGKFVETGDPAAKQALRGVRDELENAELDVERARELVARAESAVRESRCAELRRRRDELQPELSRAAITEAAQPLAEREADLLIQIVEARVERLALREKYRGLHRELFAIVTELGEMPPAGVYLDDDGRGRLGHGLPDESDAATSLLPVDAILCSRIDEMPPGDPRREILREFCHGYSLRVPQVEHARGYEAPRPAERPGFQQTNGGE